MYRPSLFHCKSFIMDSCEESDRASREGSLSAQSCVALASGLWILPPCEMGMNVADQLVSRKQDYCR